MDQVSPVNLRPMCKVYRAINQRGKEKDVQLVQMDNMMLLRHLSPTFIAF